MIRINAFVEVINIENKVKVLELAKELVANSLKEDGCIAYDIFESVTRPNVLLFCETWKDKDILAIHEKTEHFVRLVPQIDKLAKMKIEQFVI